MPDLWLHDQPRIGGKLLDAVEPRDVVNLIEDRQCEQLADAGHRAPAMEGIAVMLLGLADDRQLEVGDQCVS